MRAVILRLWILLLPVLALGACASPRLMPAGEANGIAHLVQDETGAMAMIARDGAALPMEIYPPVIATAARGVILGLHSFGDYRRGFDDLAPALTQAGYMLYSLDQRGFGGSSHPGIWSGTESMARDLLDLIQVARRQHPALPISVIGESMGASVALAALDFDAMPEVESFIFASPATRRGVLLRAVGDGAAYGLARLMPGLQIPTDRSFYDNVTPGALARLSDDPLVLRRLRPDAFEGLLRLMDDGTDAAHQLQQRSLILYGRHDNLILPQAICHLRRQIGGDVLGLQYEDGPHLVLQWERQDLVQADILAWLNNASPPSLKNTETARNLAGLCLRKPEA